MPSDIKDSLLRAFTKNERPFWALKIYVDQTEDKELTAKVGIVEKYGNRIPELVKRLQNCYEANYNNAGLFKNNNDNNINNHPFDLRVWTKSMKSILVVMFAVLFQTS